MLGRIYVLGVRLCQLCTNKANECHLASKQIFVFLFFHVTSHFLLKPDHGLKLKTQLEWIKCRMCSDDSDKARIIYSISTHFCLCVVWTMTQTLFPTCTLHAAMFMCAIRSVYMCIFTKKCTPVCEYVRQLHTSVCLSYVCKPFVVASVALLLHIHMFFMGWLMELSSSCLCDVVYCCLMCSGILHRRAPRADLIT